MALAFSPSLLAIAALALPSLLAGGESAPGYLVAALTITPEPWNKAANLARLERYARQAAAQGAEVIVAPEGFLEGYVGNDKRTPDLTEARYAAEAPEELSGPLLGRVRSLARSLRVHLMLGFAEKREGKVFNSAVMFSPEGAVALHYSKSHTLADEPFNAKGAAFPVMRSPHGVWGALICFDRQLPETARLLALQGADTIFVPAWGSYGEINDIMMRVRAYENGVNIAFVHPKRSLLIDSAGKIVAQSHGETDQVVLARFTVNPKRKHSLLPYRRPELYGPLAARPRE